MYFRASLINYPQVVNQSNPIEVTVNRYVCNNLTTYTIADSWLAARNYTIGDSLLSFAVPNFTSTPFSCSETVNYNLTKQDGTKVNPNVINFDGTTVKIWTNDTAYAGLQTLRVRITRS
jgi:hypothetical protein